MAEPVAAVHQEEEEEEEDEEDANPGVEAWTNEQVVAFIKAGGMEAIASKFEDKEVTGLDLMLLSEDEMKVLLGISRMQAAKVKLLLASDEAKAAAEEADKKATADAAAELEGLRLAVSEASATVPALSANAEDYGDAGEMEELERAVSVSYTRRAPPVVAAAVVGTPAAAIAAPPTGLALPPGTETLRIDDGTVARYVAATAAISELEAEGVALALPAARTRLQELTKRRDLQKSKVEELESELAKMQNQAKSLEESKWHPGKYLLPSMYKGKIEKAKGKAEEKNNELEAAGSTLEKLHEQVLAATATFNSLTAKVAELNQSREFCASLLENAFRGFAVGDAHEHALEQEVLGLGPRIEEARRYKSVYSQALELAKQAHKAMSQAHGMLQTAMGLARVDVASNIVRPRMGPRGRGRPMRNTTGGLVVDLVKRQKMRQGVALAQQGADLAIKARKLIPDMPRVDVKKVNEMRVGLGIMDIVFDNIVTDLIVARKIRNMLNLVQECVADIGYAEKWLDGWLKGRIEQDLKGMEATLAMRRGELHAHRAMLMRAWVEAKARGAGGPGAPAAAAPATGTPVAYIL